MRRIGIFVFGVTAHAMFLAVFAYMAAFVGNFAVPRTIDAPAMTTPLAVALAVNMVLLGVFGVQHSVMARPGFKRWWTQFVPPAVERSVYVMISNLLVIALFVLWQPIDIVIWNITNPIARGATWGLFAAGWLLIPGASFLINHFDLFGTRQVWLHLVGKPYAHLPFRTPVLYKFVRHPLYVGWMLAFWVTPTMTLGHLLFASVLSAYMLIAIQFEERDLVAHFGELYENYRRRVPMLIPARRASARDGGELVGALGTESMN
jgi:protein-S-isoprenylcysteine O-methyltransferase Ste14